MNASLFSLAGLASDGSGFPLSLPRLYYGDDDCSAALVGVVRDENGGDSSAAGK